MFLQILSVLTLLGALAIGLRNPGVLFAGCLFTYQAGAVSGFGWIGSAYIAVGSAVALARYTVAPFTLRLTSADVTLLALVLYLVTSSLWSPIPTDAMGMSGQLLLSVAGMYLIARLQRADIGSILKDMTIGTVVIGAVMCYCMLAMRVTENAHQTTRLYISNEDASTVGLSMPLPFAMLAAVTLMYLAPKRWMTAMATMAFALIAYCSIASATRSVFLAFGVGLIVTLWLARKSISIGRYMLTGALGIAAVPVLIGIMPTDQLANLYMRLFGNFSGGQVEADASSIERLYLWSDGYGMFLHNPMFGTGFGSFGMFSFFTYPHNMTIEVAAAGGIVGLVLLMAWLGALFVTLWRAHRRNPGYGAFLIGITVVALAQLQVSFAFFMARPLFLACAVAAALASAQLDATRPVIRRQPRRRFDYATAGR